MKKYVWMAALFLAAFYAHGAASRRTCPIITPQYKYSGETLIEGMHVRLLSVLDIGNRLEDANMQIVYQLARRSVAKVAVKDSAGSGIVFKINEDGIIIVSNKHLLMKDVKAEVTFINGESAEAEIIGYSQQYDIGFLKVSGKNANSKLLRDIYEAVPADYLLTAIDAHDFNVEYANCPVLQIGADLHRNGIYFFAGHIIGIGYEPVFNTEVLKTKCYAMAGMSGGGVFDVKGRLLGMLSGGEVSDGSGLKEAEVSYSIPVTMIFDEYDAAANGGF